MTKSIALISEVIHENRPPFRQMMGRPHKPQKHRYERRKVRAYLRLADWTTVD
jgi:hypothetical protein